MGCVKKCPGNFILQVVAVKKNAMYTTSTGQLHVKLEPAITNSV